MAADFGMRGRIRALEQSDLFVPEKWLPSVTVNCWQIAKREWGAKAPDHCDIEALYETKLRSCDQNWSGPHRPRCRGASSDEFAGIFQVSSMERCDRFVT